MKKYIGFIGVAMVNCMLITGLLTHAFTLDSVKDNTVNDSKKECVYIKETKVKEEKEINPEERQQENNNKDNNKDYATNNTNDYVIKTTITKSTYNNSKNNSNDNKNYSNINTNNSNSNENNSNTNNNTNNSNNNNNYTVEYANISYCGFCGKCLNNNDGICQDCREIRSKLGE